VNIAVDPPADIRAALRDYPRKRSWIRKQQARLWRLERDSVRGYSINVKQVVLAFAVEFVIIGLVLVSQFAYAAQFPNPSEYKTLQAILFPLAFAVVELARVPLAIAVRIQKSWNIKLAALLGVMCAVVVTSFSLSQIGHLTFNPRLEAVHDKENARLQMQADKQSYAEQKSSAQTLVDQSVKSRDNAFKAQQNALHELNAQPSQNCSPYQKLDQYGRSLQGQTCKENPALKTLKSELESASHNLADAETALKQAQANLAKYDTRSSDQKIAKAEEELRDAIYQSPLHSYTAMLFKKDQREVTDGEVKTLEWYLIFIPSIAAALSSTLIAITAVHRIRPKETEKATTIPDEAAAYLFGPLVGAINQQVQDAVASAMNGTRKADSLNPEQPQSV
jgi:hypothetical protein